MKFLKVLKFYENFEFKKEIEIFEILNYKFFFFLIINFEIF
jgi:hypothetical protein